MNKTELKDFAVEARRDLMAKIILKLEQYGITEDNQELKMEENYGQLIVNGNTYPIEMKHAFQNLLRKLNAVKYEQLIEEVAYTWFNRIIAIRYMEVNNYLPDRVNVLSSSTGKEEPDIMFQYETMNLDIDHQQIRDLGQQENNERVYRKLFVAQCNALNKLLPSLFEKIEDYTELLLPDYLLDEDSIIRKVVRSLSDRNFYQLHDDESRSDNVEVLGWLYQYYMSEKKEQVGGLKNTAVKKEDLPIVTQLFTPKWIVQYMVQNSLGKLYDEKYEDNQLAQHWEYYLKHEENHHLYPEFDSLEDLKIMDPACGSGHILIYAFEMLYDMYEEAGYPLREIPQLILENNLYGLDIDKRAQQIASFALLMKAAEKQPRFISRLSRKGINPKLNVYEIMDTDQSLSEEAIDYFAKDETEKSLISELLNQFENGKQFGSLINPIENPYGEWINRIYNLERQKRDLMDESYINELKEKFIPLLEQALLLYQEYHAVLTNPPYHNKYNTTLRNFMKINYKEYKSDLYSAFIHISGRMTKANGYSALMTPYTWLFNTNNIFLRKNLIGSKSISSLVLLEYSAFKDATVPICTFVIQNQLNYQQGEYLNLSNKNGDQSLYVRDAVTYGVNYRYAFNLKKVNNIKGYPISFWGSDKIYNLLNQEEDISSMAKLKAGVSTGANELFQRQWFEVNLASIGFNYNDITETIGNQQHKWYPCNSGGEFRKWYGNNLVVINWYNNGEEIRNCRDSQGKLKSAVRNDKYYFKEGITWTKLSSSNFGVRFKEQGFIFDDTGRSAFCNTHEDNILLIGLLCSKVPKEIMGILNPTLSITNKDIARVPVKKLDQNIKDKILKLSQSNINISKLDWDSYEISWDFKTHPFITCRKSDGKISEAFKKWQYDSELRFKQLKSNEEKLNKILIVLYGLKDEMAYEVDDKDITLTLANIDGDVKSFLSYFVGCVMGRFSLDTQGFAHAGGAFDDVKYETFKPNRNGLIQLTDDYYFDNDIIVRLREFLSVAFSPDTVDENMQWLAESLEIKDENPEERLRRYFLDEFFKEHCKTYQKRPIYWLVDSGKQKGLRTLLYMHRYQPDTMATIRFEHLQEIQSKYQNEIDGNDTRLTNPSLTATRRKEIEKSKTDYQKKLDELQEFDKQLATYANQQIPIDLDDGVKVNHAKFENVLAKIK